MSECDDRNKFLKSTWLLTKAHRLGIFTDNLMRKVQSGKTKLKLNLKLFENVEEKVCSAKAVEKIKGSREQVWCIVHKDPRKCNQENPGELPTYYGQKGIVSCFAHIGINPYIT